MKFITYLIAGSLIGAMLAVESCASDHDAPAAPRGEMSLRISFDDDGDATRASATESQVSDVAVMLFTAGPDGTPATLYDCVEARNLTPRTGGYNFDASIDLDAGDVPESLVAVLLCNAASSAGVSMNAVNALKGRSFSDVAVSLTAPFSVSGCGGITMSGTCSPVIDTGLAAQRLRASVVRDRARMDVDASAVTPDIFSLSELYVYRHNSLVALLPRSASLPEIPDGSVTVGSSRFPVTPLSNRIGGEVYIPESDVLMGGDGDISDSNRLRRTAIVVGGHYRGSSQTGYYRIDFTDADGRLVDVVRNHRYVANITAVNGPGSDTPDEAYAAITAGISATVLDWERSDEYIVFDGAHWLSVESRDVTVGPDAGNSALLSVASDIPASEWRMAWTDAGDATLPGTMAGDAVAEGRFFRVTRPEGEATEGAHLLFEALSALPEGLADRSETLHILAGDRLHLRITVTQCDLTASPWTDGGRIDLTQ